MLGLPEAGKTTFLAALWYLGTSSTDDSSFKVKQLVGDISYLNAISRAWLECTPLPRTKVRENNVAELAVTDAFSGEAIRLVVPDLSGEVFREGIANRQWDSRAAAAAAHADGILLFINPAQVASPSWIFQRVDGSRASLGAERAWSPIESPTQVQLVDLLQTVNRLRQNAPVKCSVIVSAWDVAAATYAGPGQWIAESLPLLDEFLTTSIQNFPNKMFGISAQGGPLPHSEKELLEVDPQIRVRVIEGPERSSSDASTITARSPYDLAAPVRWLTN